MPGIGDGAHGLPGGTRLDVAGANLCAGGLVSHLRRLRHLCADVHGGEPSTVAHRDHGGAGAAGGGESERGIHPLFESLQFPPRAGLCAHLWRRRAAHWWVLCEFESPRGFPFLHGVSEPWPDVLRSGRCIGQAAARLPGVVCQHRHGPHGQSRSFGGHGGRRGSLWAGQSGGGLENAAAHLWQAARWRGRGRFTRRRGALDREWRGAEASCSGESAR